MAPEQEKCSSEDVEFLKELIQECQPMIVWTARKSANYSHEAVEEVLQETMVRLVKKVSKLESMDRRAQYVYIEQTIKTTALNYLHRKNLETHLFEQTEDFEEEIRTIPDMSLPPEAAVEHKEYVESRYKAFRKLTKEERQIMLQKYFLGLSDKELAKQLKCKPDSVRMVLSRIRKKVRSLIEEKEKDDE